MSIDWAKIRKQMPMEKTPEAAKARRDLFMQFDPNNNGYLSLAEVDKGCKDILGLYEIFDAKPVMLRAFQMAKSVNSSRNKKGSHGPDYIERCEFRLLLVYLRMYLELWVMFQSVDTSGDRRVDITEFKKALPLLERWGVHIADPDAAFASIDTNGGGQILFQEFCDWAIQQHADLDDDDE